MSVFQSIARVYRFADLTQQGNLYREQANLINESYDAKIPMDMTYGQRLKLAREAKKLTQKALASQAGISQSALSELESKGQGSSYSAVFAEILGVRPLWLSTGEGEMTENVTNAQVKLGRVPLVSSVAAGMFEDSDLMPAAFADEWVTCSVPTKERTFALRVEGDSMEPRFCEGMVLIVEPEMSARPGDFVIAKTGEHDATFKQLVRDGGDFYLKPLNPRYPMRLLGGSTIVGVVRQALENFR